MQFIERIFGIAPDGGSGALELLLLALPCAAWLAFRIARARGGAEPRPSLE